MVKDTKKRQDKIKFLGWTSLLQLSVSTGVGKHGFLSWKVATLNGFFSRVLYIKTNEKHYRKQSAARPAATL